MKKRKIFASILVLALLALASCSGKTAPSGTTPQPSSESTSPSESPSENEILDKTEEVNGDIQVLGEIIEAPPPSVDGDNGVILVPLVPIAEKLGIEVTWDEEDQMARVGEDISIWVGKDHYAVGENAPTKFGPAPSLIDNEVYVPLYFWGTVLTDYSAYISEGTIVVELAA